MPIVELPYPDLHLFIRRLSVIGPGREMNRKTIDAVHLHDSHAAANLDLIDRVITYDAAVDEAVTPTVGQQLKNYVQLAVEDRSEVDSERVGKAKEALSKALRASKLLNPDPVDHEYNSEILAQRVVDALESLSRRV